MASFDSSIDNIIEKYKYRDLKGNGLKINFDDIGSPDLPEFNNLPPSNVKPPLSLNPEMLKVLGIGLLLVLLTIAIIILLRYILKRKVTNNKEIQNIIEEIIENDFSTNELQNIINKYELENDYKNSIRYLFIYLLINLKQKQIILIHQTRTNFQIANDVKNNCYIIYDNFIQIVYTFNKTWYGNKEINKDTYFQTKGIVNNILAQGVTLYG